MVSMCGIRYLAYQSADGDGTYRIAAYDAMASFRRVLMTVSFLVLFAAFAAARPC